MTEAENFYHQLINDIPAVKPGKMFGAQCIKTPNGKAAAMFWKDNLVVKLKGWALQEAASLDGSTFFDPMGGRPMKEWIQIPFEYKDRWKEFASLSAAFVKGL